MNITGLHGHLVQIEHDGYSGHEEQEEYHPELAHSGVAFPALPEDSKDTKDEGKCEEHIASLVLFEELGQSLLVAHQQIVDKADTCNPVASVEVAMSLKVVLATHEIPEEIAPIHVVQLVVQEETEIVPLCRHLNVYNLATNLVFHVVAGDFLAYPSLDLTILS